MLTLRRVLVELSVMEQRYRAVLQVQAGVPVTEVAEALGVSRQAVHRWLAWYVEQGLSGLADRSHRTAAKQQPIADCDPDRAHAKPMVPDSVQAKANDNLTTPDAVAHSQAGGTSRPSTCSRTLK
jgi:transposase-like protein